VNTAKIPYKKDEKHKLPLKKPSKFHSDMLTIREIELAPSYSESVSDDEEPFLFCTPLQKQN
jgi:hypothetical protein